MGADARATSCFTKSYAGRYVRTGALLSLSPPALSRSPEQRGGEEEGRRFVTLSGDEQVRTWVTNSTHAVLMTPVYRGVQCWFGFCLARASH